MSEQGWTWDKPSSRYRDPKSGRYLSHAQVTKLRNEFTDARKTAIRELVESILPEGPGDDMAGWRTAVNRFDREGWPEVRRSLTSQYLHGRGGINAMTAADKTVLQAMLKEQHGYWQQFVRDARNLDGIASSAGVSNRAGLYIETGTRFYETGREQSFDIRLPAMPADGGTECGSSCRCSWNITATKTKVKATWTLGGNSEVCGDCQGRRQRYNPYEVER